MKKLIVMSLDYDGCTAKTISLEESKQTNPVDTFIADNEQLVKEFEGYLANDDAKVIACIGSNRQDIHQDFDNTEINMFKDTGSISIFSALPSLVKFIKSKNADYDIQFDSYLAIDAQQGNEKAQHYEETYKNIGYISESRIPGVSDKKQIEQLPRQFIDESKISTIYAQMHHFAKLHPNEKIEFIFKDDRKDILEGLNQFYSQNPKFIPLNITLKLEQKFSKQLEDASDIRQKCPERWGAFETQIVKGIGEIDAHYTDTTTAMLVIAHNKNLDMSNLNLKNELSQMILLRERGIGFKGDYMSKEFNKMLGEYKIATGDPEALRTRQKTFEWSFSAAAFVIGAVIGAALVATGVLAPLGIGLWATMAIIAVTSGIVAAPLGRGAGLAVAKSTEPVKEIKGAVADDEVIQESYGNAMRPVLSMPKSLAGVTSSNNLTQELQTNDSKLPDYLDNKSTSSEKNATYLEEEFSNHVATP
jgi:hypothetical protein